VTEKNELAVVNGSSRYVKAGKVKKVFIGRDHHLYYITTEGGLIKDQIKTGIQADRAAVTAEGAVWFVKDGSLHDGTGKRVAEGVNDVALDTEGRLWYCGYGYISHRKDGLEEKWHIEYNASAIAASGDGIYILDENQRVYGVSGRGINAFRICNNTYDITTDFYDVLYAVQSPQKGKLRISHVSAIM
jgi:hypothetical protein